MSIAGAVAKAIGVAIGVLGGAVIEVSASPALVGDEAGAGCALQA
jgi:hypothetical protein